jgi:DNA-binding response OmpR family regulator
MTEILLVDDDEDILYSLKEGIESYDSSFTVYCAKNAKECMDYVAKNTPGLILLDIMLPDMDGFTLRAKLKRTAAKDVPVIYLSAKNDEQTRKIGHVTAQDFIAKPVEIPEIVLRVRKILKAKGRSQT